MKQSKELEVVELMIRLYCAKKHKCKDGLCAECNELLEYVKKFDNDSLYVIGGARVYAELLDYCDTAYITRFYTSFDNADAFIENFDALEGWKLEKQSAIMEEKGIKYSFCTYVKVKEGNN